MSQEFKVEIVNPDQAFFSSEKATEVVVPAFEGDMGILKDHISIISFLKPGIIKISISNEEEKFYVDDGIIEFKDNQLSVLTSSIFNLKNVDKNVLEKNLKEAEKQLKEEELSDQNRFLISQKVDVLKSIN